MKISVLHASRQRPEKAREARIHWMLRTSGQHEIEYILSIDQDDPTLSKYLELFTDPLISGNTSAVDAFNIAAEHATGDILVAISDDFECPENWDAEIVKHAQGRKNWIMKTQDGTQGWIITLPIMDRAYYESQGYIYFPDYLHMFCDTELTAVADLRNSKITTSLNFPHKNDINDKISERANRTWNQGKKLFLERRRFNFGLPPDQIKGRITDKTYRDWLKAERVI